MNAPSGDGGGLHGRHRTRQSIVAYLPGRIKARNRTSDYVDKAGVFAAYAEGKKFRIDEPHLLDCFAVPRAVVGAMTEAALRKSSGSSFSSQPPPCDPGWRNWEAIHRLSGSSEHTKRSHSR